MTVAMLGCDELTPYTPWVSISVLRDAPSLSHVCAAFPPPHLPTSPVQGGGIPRMLPLKDLCSSTLQKIWLNVF